MNDFERRFYGEPQTRNIPVGQLSTMKEICQKILLDIKEENPYAVISDLLAEPDEYEYESDYGDVSGL